MELDFNNSRIMAAVNSLPLSDRADFGRGSSRSISRRTSSTLVAVRSGNARAKAYLVKESTQMNKYLSCVSASTSQYVISYCTYISPNEFTLCDAQTLMHVHEARYNLQSTHTYHFKRLVSQDESCHARHFHTRFCLTTGARCNKLPYLNGAVDSVVLFVEASDNFVSTKMCFRMNASNDVLYLHVSMSLLNTA